MADRIVTTKKKPVISARRVHRYCPRCNSTTEFTVTDKPLSNGTLSKMECRVCDGSLTTFRLKKGKE